MTTTTELVALHTNPIPGGSRKTARVRVQVPAAEAQSIVISATQRDQARARARLISCEYFETATLPDGRTLAVEVS